MRYCVFLFSILLCMASFAKDSAFVMLYAWDNAQKQFKVFVAYGVIDWKTQTKGWDFLGGEIDPGESPQQAAAREAYEESVKFYGYDHKTRQTGKTTSFTPQNLISGGRFQHYNPQFNKNNYYFYFQEVNYTNPSAILTERNKQTNSKYTEREDFGWVLFQDVYAHAKDIMIKKSASGRTLNVLDKNYITSQATRPFMWVAFANQNIMDIMHQINQEELKRKANIPAPIPHPIPKKPMINETLGFWYSIPRNSILPFDDIEELTALKEDPHNWYFKTKKPSEVNFQLKRDTLQNISIANHFDYLVLTDAIESPEKKLLMEEWRAGDTTPNNGVPAVMVAPEWCVTFGDPYKNCLLYKNKFYNVKHKVSLGDTFSLCQLTERLPEPIANVARINKPMDLSLQNDYQILGFPTTIKSIFPIIKNDVYLGSVEGNQIPYPFPSQYAPFKDYCVLASAVK